MNGGNGAAARDAPVLANACLFSGQPRKAHTVWSRAGFHLLGSHLHNGNTEHRFAIGFIGDFGPAYARNKSRALAPAISWAWKTITTEGKTKWPLALVFYSQNERGESRWGVLDFDARDGEDGAARARTLAFAAFRELLAHPSLFLILETSGSGGGWHVWAIARDLQPVEEWARLLSGICAQIGAAIRPGVCEIFPPDSARSKYGRGVRAPGCWNPKGGFSEIVYENCAELLRTIRDGPAALPPIGKLGGSDLSGNSGGKPRREFREKRKKLSFALPISTNDLQGSSSGEAAREPIDAPLYREWPRSWSTAFAIIMRDTRNAQLCSLTGAMFHQVGRKMAERIAAEQFRTKRIATKAGIRKHLENLADCWRGLEKAWLARLNENEREAFESLATQHERDAFRIALSYARYAREKHETEFPIARDNLGERLGITGQGAGKIRMKLVEFRIVRLAQLYRQHRTANRYVWTAHESMPQEP